MPGHKKQLKEYFRPPHAKKISISIPFGISAGTNPEVTPEEVEETPHGRLNSINCFEGNLQVNI